MSDKLTLHDYQLVARDFLRGRPQAALMLDMGLGKTASVLAALEPRHLPVLVVAPKKVAENVWEEERDLWRPDLTIAVVKGEPAARHALLALERDVIVISRDNLRDVLAVKRATPFKTLVLDELSGFKSRASVRWKTAFAIAWKLRGVQHIWGLTGTPAPNGYLDLWPQIALLDKGERLGKNITTYRSRYFYPGRQLPSGVIIEWILRPEAEAHIKAKIEDICLSMETEGRIQLPEVTYNVVPVPLSPKVMKIYKEFEDNMVADLRDVFGPGALHTASSAAVVSSRLSQLTAGFMYVDDAANHDYAFTEIHTEKMDALKEIIDSPHHGGVLVFYSFRAELEMIKRELKDYGCVEINEDGAVKAWNRGEVPVLLAHPASAGHGLNLQHGGHTIVWTSGTWDLELWEQGNKRLPRQGQKHPVVIHLLAAPKTVDMRMRSVLIDKAELQGDLLDYLGSPI